VRDAISNGKILERICKDIRLLLLGDEKQPEDDDFLTEFDFLGDIVALWDEKRGLVKNAVSYGRELDDQTGALESCAPGAGSLATGAPGAGALESGALASAEDFELGVGYGALLKDYS
jgi:hypothetical protein